MGMHNPPHPGSCRWEEDGIFGYGQIFFAAPTDVREGC